jgi:acetyltransferase-like isoleucine patch superfamily enzyme
VKYFFVVAIETLSWLIFLMPRFRFLNSLKCWYLRFFFRAKLGKRIVFYPGVWIFTGRNFRVGDDVDFAKGVLVTTDGGVVIGDRVLIGYGTHILSSNHVVPKRPLNIFDSGHSKAPVIIENDVWIGACCILLPGTPAVKGVVVAKTRYGSRRDRLAGSSFIKSFTQ